MTSENELRWRIISKKETALIRIKKISELFPVCTMTECRGCTARATTSGEVAGWQCN